MLEEFLDFSFVNRKDSLTLREYITIKDNKDLAKIYNKHLIYFYNYLLKNGLILSKEDFIIYYNSGMSLKEISKKSSIPYEYLLLIKLMYGIKTKGATFINRKRTEIKLTQRQKEIVYGSLMGDAKKESPSNVGFVHCLEQEEYSRWKFEELKTVSSEKSLKLWKNKDIKRNKVYNSYRFYTRANSDIEDILSKFYISGKKEITKEILNNLSELSLAVWYMDDGYTDWGKRFKNKGINFTERYSLCTDSFSTKSNKLIVEWFKEKYEIDSYINSRNRIIIRNRSSQDFNSIINKYIIESMRYKINYYKYIEKVHT